VTAGAILSTLPIDSHRQLQGFSDRIRPVQTRDPEIADPATLVDEALTNRSSRAVHEATVTIAGEAVTVLCCHFKSKLIR